MADKKFIYEPDKFSYSYEFQIEIIVAGIQDQNFFIKSCLDIQPIYFETTSLKIIFAALKKYYQKYGCTPDKIKLIEYIPDKYKNSCGDLSDIIETIYEYKSLTISEIEFITDTIVKFAKHQAMKRAIIESMDKLDDIEKFDQIKKDVEDALLVGFNENDFGSDGYNDIKEIEKRFKKRSDKTDIKRVPTGFSELDASIGGIGQGELFSFIGPPKSGKSMFLVNISVSCLLQKKNVLHITLEMPESRILERFDMRLLNATKEEICLPANLRKIKEIVPNLGKLIVKEFPVYTLDPLTLELYIQKLIMSKNFKPDLLVVDYADIMRSTRNYSQKRHEIDDIYYGLSSIAQKFSIAVLTGTQANRDASKRLQNDGDIIDLTDVAESLGISRVVSTLVSINKTPADDRRGRVKLSIAASRYSEGGKIISLYSDYSRCTVRDILDSDTKNNMDLVGKKS